MRAVASMRRHWPMLFPAVPWRPRRVVLNISRTSRLRSQLLTTPQPTELHATHLLLLVLAVLSLPRAGLSVLVTRASY
jgi:hypothetical protein